MMTFDVSILSKVTFESFIDHQKMDDDCVRDDDAHPHLLIHRLLYFY
jgi:hypothetical protein